MKIPEHFLALMRLLQFWLYSINFGEYTLKFKSVLLLLSRIFRNRTLAVYWFYIQAVQIIKRKVLHIFLTSDLDPTEVTHNHIAGFSGVAVTPTCRLGIFYWCLSKCFELDIDNQLRTDYISISKKPCWFRFWNRSQSVLILPSDQSSAKDRQDWWHVQLYENYKICIWNMFFGVYDLH